jgi:hypothetical protein
MGGQAQSAARAIAAGRVVVGTSLCVAPRLAAQWAGDEARASGVGVIVRALGARDAALGIGTLLSSHDPGQLRRWLVASSACDAADFAATLAGPRSPARTFVLATAAAATVAGLAAAATT